MQRFCRSHLLCIWCCAILVVSSYVLFDLLDIDGSNFDHSPGSGMAAEERLAREEGRSHVALEFSAAALLPRVDRWAMIRPTSIPRAPLTHFVFSQIRARAALPAQSTTSTKPDTDPARRSAQP